MPAFPTHGYSRHLLGEISSPGTEGFSSFHIFLHTMSPESGAFHPVQAMFQAQSAGV
jgi:hypothetical protein